MDGAFGSQHGQHWRRTRAAAETAGCRLGRRRRDRPRAQLRRPRERPAANCVFGRSPSVKCFCCARGFSARLLGSAARLGTAARSARGSSVARLLFAAAARVSESGFFGLRPCLCAEVGLRQCVCAPFGAIPPSMNPLVLPFRSLVCSRLRSRGDGKRRCRARLRLRLRLRWVVGWVLLVGAQSRTRARVE